MLSILNILKKHHDEKKERSGAGAGLVKDNVFQGPVNLPGVPPGLGEFRQSCPAGVNIFPPVNPEIARARLEEAGKFYNELGDLARKTYQAEPSGPLDLEGKFREIFEKELSWLNSDTQELLQLCLSDYDDRSQAFYSHAVNVSIIALELGRGLNYDKRQLFELGTAALLHDIGSVKYLDLINKNARFSEQELLKVREHPLAGIDLLNKMGRDIPSWLTNVVSQEHERLDGSGYPKALKDDQIKESAQIVGLADVYEAMTHFRPYRERFSPPKAMNIILSKKEIFSPKVLKILLERIGVFPVGTIVRLNTKEVGMVCKVNRGLPLRPQVVVMFDENSNQLDQARQIDLSANLLVCIEECLDVAGKKPVKP